MNSYLNKYGFQSPKISPNSFRNVGIIVVIPCFDEKEITTTLNSLLACDSPQNGFAVIVVVNQSEIVDSVINIQNLETLSILKEWNQKNSEFPLWIMDEMKLPKKHAGVGLARKIGMDEAVNLFYQNQTDGIIVALDSDCTVAPNYLIEIEKHFVHNPTTPGCSIKYSHPLNGKKEAINSGIIQYELHLRYYNQAMRICGLPYAFHTVGSSMAVRSSAYQKQGGMNKRKAGEDFYFLQKIIELGGFTELNTTTIVPSARISDRVPFGTGKAIGDFIERKNVIFATYNWDSFVLLSHIPPQVPSLYSGKSLVVNNRVVEGFLETIDFENKVAEIRKNTSSYEKFEKRFYTFFNAFTVLKYTHYLRDNGFPNKPIAEEAKRLLDFKKISIRGTSAKELLLYYRKLDQE